MDASVLLGVNMITTFIGRDSKKNVDENMELVKRSGHRLYGMQRKRACGLPLKTVNALYQ